MIPPFVIVTLTLACTGLALYFAYVTGQNWISLGCAAAGLLVLLVGFLYS